MNASTRYLLLTNAVVTILAVVLHWSLAELLWTYWIQSVVIGWYAYQRMRHLVAFNT